MKKEFGRIGDQMVWLYQLKNQKGVTVDITNYGAVIVSMMIPDRHGVMADVVLGYESLKAYQEDVVYFGAVIGPCAGRMSNASFTLDGVTYHLDKNSGGLHLHGGNKGFSKCVWQEVTYDGSQLTLLHKHHHLDSGYPGNIEVWLTYRLDEQNCLQMESKVMTDRKAVFNMTYHPYFNLKGAGSGTTILDHELMIAGSQILATDERLLPTGKFVDVSETPFDFRSAKPIGRDLHQSHPLLYGGYDHSWVLHEDRRGKEVAFVYEPTSGRTLRLITDMPSLVCYTSNQLSIHQGKNGLPYKPQTAFCLEPQQFTDAPNHPHFPSIVILPNESYQSKTLFCFGVA